MIVKNFKKSRENLGLTQKDIAEIFGLHYTTVSGWETGKDTIPIKRLIEYANKFDLSLDYLFGITLKNEKYYPINLNLTQLARNLKELRCKNILTQVAVARKLNTSQGAYSHYEMATNVIPTSFIYNLTKIYKPFSTDKLLGRKKVKNSELKDYLINK